MVVTLTSSRTPRRIERGQAIKRFLPRKAKDFLHHKSASIEQNGGKLPFLRFRNRVSGKVGPNACCCRPATTPCCARYADTNHDLPARRWPLVLTTLPGGEAIATARSLSTWSGGGSSTSLRIGRPARLRAGWRSGRRSVSSL